MAKNGVGEKNLDSVMKENLAELENSLRTSPRAWEADPVMLSEEDKKEANEFFKQSDLKGLAMKQIKGFIVDSNNIKPSAVPNVVKNGKNAGRGAAG